MSNVTNDLGLNGFSEIDNVQDYSEYRVTSRKAMFSLIILIFSIWGFASTSMLAFAIGGIVLGVMGLREISQYPDEYSGFGLAIAGTAANSSVLILGIALQTYIYATEVPDGYVRTSWKLLQPSKEHPNRLPPDTAVELNGAKVFMTGYVHPAGVSGSGYVNEFVMVPDMKTCCFGGQPEYSDMIEVKLPIDKPIKYSTRRRKLMGTLTVTNMLVPVEELEGVFYQLDADGVR